MTGAELCAILAAGRFRLTVEKQTQADIFAHLSGYIPAMKISREHRLSGADIPDFLIDDTIVIEVKLKSAKSPAVFDQLERYAAHCCVKEIVLVTNKSMGLPPEIGGKAAYYLSLGRAWL
jgi:hypothetical protein